MRLQKGSQKLRGFGVHRHVLFLQGPPGPFFKTLGQAVQDQGAAATRINLCAGDRICWNGPDAIDYHGGIEKWPAYLEQFIESQGVTDVVMFTDCRPYHRQAARVCRRLGIVPLVFEHGYLRPNWVTMELGGVNGNSSFPRKPEAIERLAPTEARQEAEPVPSEGGNPYFWDIVFHLANWTGKSRYPNYVRHRAPHPVMEVLGWIRKGLEWQIRKRQSERRLSKLLDDNVEFFFFPLQLDHDYQMIQHSPFASIRKAMKHVFKSFAETAPKDVHLLVKNHPLDNFLTDRRSDTARLAKRYGIADRVHYLETGHNPTILERTKGMVTVNSTMGVSALHHGLPLYTLGAAVYDVEGLTHPGSLEDFWRAPRKPDRELFLQFRRLLIERTQVHGRFANPACHQYLVSAALEKMFGVNETQLTVAWTRTEAPAYAEQVPEFALIAAE